MQQTNNTAEKTTRQRALILCAMALLVLVAALKLLGIFGHFPRIEATITDAADSSPLSGATIVALYGRGCVGSDDNERTVISSHETTSDANGVFVLDEVNVFTSPGPKAFSMGLCQFADEPDIYIVKPGYIAAKISEEFPAIFTLTPLDDGDEMEGLRLSVKALKTLVADSQLAEAVPAFYARLESELVAQSARYYTLHKAHVDSLQEQLKKMSEGRGRSKKQ